MYMCIYVMVEKSQLIVLLTCNSFYHWGGGGGPEGTEYVVPMVMQTLCSTFNLT